MTTTTVEIIAQIRKDIAAGKRIFIPIWTHCCGRVEFTLAVRQLHAAGEIQRAPDGTAHWEGVPQLKLVG